MKSDAMTIREVRIGMLATCREFVKTFAGIAVSLRCRRRSRSTVPGKAGEIGDFELVQSSPPRSRAHLGEQAKFCTSGVTSVPIRGASLILAASWWLLNNQWGASVASVQSGTEGSVSRR